MSYLTRNTPQFSQTNVPDVFIDEYMPKAKNHFAFVAVYLLACRYHSVGLPLSLVETAQKLGLLMSDVRLAWQFWAEQGIVNIHNDSQDQFVVELLPLLSQAEKSMGLVLDGTQKAELGSALLSKNTQEAIPQGIFHVEERPTYSVADVNEQQSSVPEVAYLFAMAEKMLAKPLHFNEMSLLLSFYDWLQLPVAVIEVMLDFCLSNNKKSLRYWEKVAMDWADNGIETVDDAESYIRYFNHEYREIMKCFGLSRRDPNQKEIAIMRRWLKELDMPLLLVQEACNKTIEQIAQPKFTYADAILTKWHENNIKTLEDVNALESEFYKNIDSSKEKRDKTRTIPKKSNVPPKPKNRFNNYKGRDWDYDKLEQLEQQQYELAERDV